jgi:hypothetical protein
MAKEEASDGGKPAEALKVDAAAPRPPPLAPPPPLDPSSPPPQLDDTGTPPRAALQAEAGRAAGGGLGGGGVGGGGVGGAGVAGVAPRDEVRRPRRRGLKNPACCNWCFIIAALQMMVDLRLQPRGVLDEASRHVTAGTGGLRGAISKALLWIRPGPHGVDQKEEEEEIM